LGGDGGTGGTKKLFWETEETPTKRRQGGFTFLKRPTGSKGGEAGGKNFAGGGDRVGNSKKERKKAGARGLRGGFPPSENSVESSCWKFASKKFLFVKKGKRGPWND